MGVKDVIPLVHDKVNNTFDFVELVQGFREEHGGRAPVIAFDVSILIIKIFATNKLPAEQFHMVPKIPVTGLKKPLLDRTSMYFEAGSSLLFTLDGKPHDLKAHTHTER